MGKYIAFVALVLSVGLVVFRGGGSGSGLDDATPPAKKVDPEILVETISHGGVVEIDDYLWDSEWTVVEFTADW